MDCRMIRVGDMVRHAGGPPMLVRHIYRGAACCVLVDQHGRVRWRVVPVREVQPLWLSIGPKSVWPAPDRIVITEDEDKRAIVPSAARSRKATKPKRSHKLKRKKASMQQTITATLFDELVAA
jgi:hypothetical protein